MYSKYMSGCNEDIHEYLKKELKKANCVFCGECLVEDGGKRAVCCEESNIVADNSIRRCTNCFWFEYPYAKEYVDFYELNKYRIWRKLTYEQRRDYYFLSILRSKSIDFKREEEISLLRDFNEIIVSFGKMKRCIKFEYIVRKMLEMRNDDRYNYFLQSKCKKTLVKYEGTWNSFR